MTISLFLFWRKASRSRHVRRRAGQPDGWRSRLSLEVLEDRCLLTTVMNLNDAGFGSLRQAIIDTPSGGMVDFQSGLTGPITLITGELLIDKDLTIAGPGADVITVSGNNASRVFDIAASFTVSISGIIVANGCSLVGGGVFNSGVLTITDSTISGNTATTSAFPGGGGGIYNSGAMTVINSTISDNSTTDMAPGGAIDNGGTLTVMSSTIRGNSALEGGAIYSFNGVSSVVNSIITGNTARNIGKSGGGGGGIGDDAGMLIISGSTISDNTATQLGGGGISLLYANALITSSNISGNSATGMGGTGGGIEKTGGTLTITYSTISDNNASGGAGGIINYGTLTMSNCTINANATHNGLGLGYGGGVYNNTIGTTLSITTITDSTISDNSADSFGGGILTQDASLLIISGSTISGNTAGKGGGIAIANGDGIITTTTAQLLNCTIVNNVATGTQTAGGITTFTYAGSSGNVVSQLLNCTIVNNVATGTSENGSQLFSGRFGSGNVDVQYRNTIISGDGSGPIFSAVGGGTFTSGGHNLIKDGTGGGFTNTDLVGTSALPIDPQLEPLGDYGGPTQTMRALPGSPVINTGDNTNAPATDQRGLPRIVLDFIDIGAVELQPSEFAGPGGSGESGGSTAPGATHPLRQTVPASVLVSVFRLDHVALYTPTAGAEGVTPAAERVHLDAFFQTLGDRTAERPGDWLSLFAGDGISRKRAKDVGLLWPFDGENVGLLNEQEGGPL